MRCPRHPAGRDLHRGCFGKVDEFIPSIPALSQMMESSFAKAMFTSR